MQSKGYGEIVLVSHSLGCRMSNEFLLANPRGVKAWVAIGMTAPMRGEDRFKFPVFDLYGEDDLPQVLEAAAQRGDAIRTLRGSRQMVVPGADHFFNGHYAELDAQVRAFLDSALR
jgi:alpha/beta superfamily hydrolase